MRLFAETVDDAALAQARAQPLQAPAGGVRWLAGAVLAKIMVLVFIILFIQRKPRGLFPQRGRAAEDS